MKILITMSGGFAGFDNEEVLRLNTDEMEESVAQLVKQKAQEIGIDPEDEQERFITGEVGADFLRYDILIEDGDQEFRITFMDDESPETEQIRSLVKDLKEIRTE